MHLLQVCKITRLAQCAKLIFSYMSCERDNCTCKIFLQIYSCCRKVALYKQLRSLKSSMFVDLFQQVLSRNSRRFEFFILDLVYRDNKTWKLLVQFDQNSTMVNLLVFIYFSFLTNLFLYIFQARFVSALLEELAGVDFPMDRICGLGIG